jgi:hypothetical protein
MDKNYIPKWKLEWYLHGALPAEECEAIAALEVSDGELRGRIDALRESDAKMLAKFPPEEMALRAEAKKPAVVPVHSFWGSWGRGGVSLWAIPAVVCAAMLIIIPVQVFFTGDIADTGMAAYEDRVKGEVAGDVSAPTLEVWRKADNAVEKLEAGTYVQAGDRLQLRYIVPESYYGALVSIDGLGVMTVHLSDSDGKAVLLTPGRPVALKTSYKLDDAPKYEAFYLITSADSFILDSVITILEEKKHPLDDMVLPKNRQITAFTLMKSNYGGAIN